MKRDRIKGRIRISITDNLPLIIFDNLNEPDDSNTKFSGLGFQPDLKASMIYFVGPSPKGCINYGTVYLYMKPNTPN
ncbi:hypothetical protein HNP38_000649 [Chryseobacterium defluvii]|uniref:Uncharacterized protein n=1 Tax=Chryseobacterium defluvii TaxID=160396 RepID=A0A840KBJ7_9FLAO|nr:hypothetical protein [Chryseobacterium defluvii]MBB4805377.1 hypothetical protein [Chryseobacterium defluvii]